MEPEDALKKFPLLARFAMSGIGYRRPPKATQFQPGKSGNPSGRPKNSKNLLAEIFDELSAVEHVREGGKEVKTTKARAIAKQLVRAAIDGDLRAAKIVMSFCVQNYDDNEPGDEPSAQELAVLNDYIDREVRRRSAATSETPKP
jgi:hypothetical protein